MNVIVTTTINAPTIALKKFASLPGWKLVVIGDLKTPGHLYAEQLPEAVYLSPEQQMAKYPELSEAIGWNCIQRRNLGFLVALEMGAEIVGVVDDDNIPLDDSWGSNLLIGNPVEVDYYSANGVFDPVGATNYPQLWHRGFPIQVLTGRDYSMKTRRTVIPGIQADFWNGDPDIDAICRMEHAPECEFDTSYFPMASGSFSPFNSQNTFIKASLLKHYFLCPGIGRMDDIWAAYHLQANTGVQVVYNKPSVYQARNPHNLTVDMVNEFLGYEKTLSLIRDLRTKPTTALFDYVPDQAKKAFELYQACF